MISKPIVAQTSETCWYITASLRALWIAGKASAIYEVIYGHAWKLQSRKTILTPETSRKVRYT
ncbi:MAG: hypothetical protein ABIW02_04680 [Nitrosospira sp.]